MSSKSERIAALEARLASLEELLSDPLALFTHALTSASDEEAREWVMAAHAKIMAHAESWSSEDSAGAAAAPSKKKKTSRAVSNSEGPKEWNIFVTAVLRELAAAAGVDRTTFFADVDESDEDAVKKAEAAFKTAAKSKGVTWQTALKEASRRKDAAEGVDHSEKEAKKAAAREKRAAKKGSSDSDSVASAPAAAAATPAKKPKKAKAPDAPKKAPKTPADPRAAFIAELAELNMKIVTLEDGSEFIAEADGGEAFFFNAEDLALGDRCGIWDAETNAIDFDA